VINRPGGGLSDGVDHRQVDLTALAVHTLSTVADAFELERVPIIANSMGGLWAFRYALANPARVTAMVQLGCPALALGTSAPFFMRLLSVPLLNRLVVGGMQPKSIDKTLAGLRFQGSSQADIDRQPRAAAAACYHAFNLPTYKASWTSLVGAVATLAGARPRYALGADALRQVDCPVQLVWGANDPFGGLSVARKMTALLPNARLHEMDVGHLPFVDRPVETGRVIGGFLAETTPAGAAIRRRQ
jgi:pimeloyl-ACP methyl ester carboxylesterase